MNKSELVKKYEEIGRLWMKGKPITEITLLKKFTFSKPQIKFFNSKKRYDLFVGGFGCGKSLPLYLKLIMMNLFWPKNRTLLGRKTLQVIEQNTLPDLFELVPPSWYVHKVKEGSINWFNGSQTILFGLDALQEGSMKDIKKAQQKIKSLNLGAYYIDQLEEIEYNVFEALNARLRRTNVELRQGNMTCNPANFWAYHYFVNGEVMRGDRWVRSEKPGNYDLTSSSMLDNKANLADDYLEDQLNHDEQYVKRYVEGIWDISILTEKAVFAEEYLKKMLSRSPVATEEGCEIYEQPKSNLFYQIGVDPSEGSVDPSSVSVISSEGRKVARYNGYTTIPGSIDKVKFLYYKYHKGLIVPEANASGIALVEGIRDLNVYKRRVFERRTNQWTEKLGWKTSFQSKQLLISHFQELLRHNFPKIYDAPTIEEFKIFEWTDSAKQKGAGARRGFHDDDVISTMLGYWGLKENRFPSSEDDDRKEKMQIQRNRQERANIGRDAGL